mmetsp:Transcript_81137/g.251810  ORF Transcript_81137/g.251810 Transcript_81137/m.251810 type:complete len:209 (+) Transcript_81137:855-1481(+)
MVRTQGELRNLANCIRKGRREESSLPPARRRQEAQDLEDGVAEAHVQKLVGLVQDQELQLIDALSEATRVVEMVLQPTGRCHKDVDRLVCKVSLVAPDVRTAVEAGDPHPPVVLQEDLALLGDLCSELPRRRKHERGDGASDAAGVLVYPLNYGDEEGERLASPRLGSSNYVLAVQHGTNGGCLHLRHELIAEALCQRILRCLADLQR